MRYLLAVGLAILLATLIITYQNYKYETSDKTESRYTKDLISRSLNVLVTDKSITNAIKRIESRYAMIYSLNVDCISIDSQQESSFLTQNRYYREIDLGDTITKSKGDKAIVVHKKGGQSLTLPVLNPFE